MISIIETGLPTIAVLELGYNNLYVDVARYLRSVYAQRGTTGRIEQIAAPADTETMIIRIPLSWPALYDNPVMPEPVVGLRYLDLRREILQNKAHGVIAVWHNYDPGDDTIFFAAKRLGYPTDPRADSRA